MTRDQQIKAALAILKPKDREQCRQRIEGELDVIAATASAIEEDRSGFVSKATKTKVMALRKALAKAQVIQKDLALFDNIDLQKEIDQCDVILTLRPEPRDGAWSSWKQLLAAQGAQGLLESYGLKVLTSRGGQWERLAAVLYGDTSANLYPYCWQLGRVR